MKRRQFRLTLEPTADDAVRLAQLSRYASDLASGGSADIGAALGGHVGALFPGRNRNAVLESLLGKGEPGWSLVSDPGQGGSLVIQTTEAGVAVSASARILEQVAPGTLLRPMIYEPLSLRSSRKHHRSLH